MNPVLATILYARADSLGHGGRTDRMEFEQSLSEIICREMTFNGVKVGEGDVRILPGQYERSTNDRFDFEVHIKTLKRDRQIANASNSARRILNALAELYPASHFLIVVEPTISGWAAN
jgi:replication initiation and membrane attachment protein DnaB